MSQGKRGKNSRRREIQLTGREGNRYQEERDTSCSYRGIQVAGERQHKRRRVIKEAREERYR